jgi:hypothetical protein
LIPDGMTIGAGPDFDEKDLVIVNVVNRGGIPVLITNLTLHEMPTFWDRLRRRTKRAFVVPNPQLKGYPPNVPSELKPAQQWTGAIRRRTDTIDLHTGAIYVGVSISYYPHPYLRKIPKANAKAVKAV